MIYANSYTNNLFTDKCIQVWGGSLESLSWNEKLWLLGDVVSALVDPSEELSDEAIEAAEAIKSQNELDSIILVRALADLLDDSVCNYLRDYLVNDWVEDAVECLGSRLQQLTINEHSWVLYKLIYNLVDGQDLLHKDELDECSKWLKSGGLTDQEELIKTARAIAELIQEQYQATPYPWEGEAPEIPGVA